MKVGQEPMLVPLRAGRGNRRASLYREGIVLREIHKSDPEFIESVGTDRSIVRDREAGDFGLGNRNIALYKSFVFNEAGGPGFSYRIEMFNRKGLSLDTRICPLGLTSG